MTLLDVAKQLDDISDEMTIYGQKVEGAWRPESPIQLVHVDPYADDDPEPPQGMRYALEIDLCKEVVEAYIDHSGNKTPSDMEKAQAIAYYAEYDCYLPVLRS